MNTTTDIITPESAATLSGLFHERVRRSPDAVAYRYFDAEHRAWRDACWRDMAAETARWQSALASEGLARGDRVAIMLGNCREWVMFEQAAMGLGLVVVPLFMNDRVDNVAYILQHAGARILLIQGAEQWASLASARDVLAKLTRIVSLAPVHEAPANVVAVQDWLPAKAAPLCRDPRGPDELATIVYTSGTTGKPKGVMLSHHNILWNAYSSMRHVSCFCNDVFLSFLPLSHTLERTIGYYLPMMAGATVAYARSIPQLGEDLLVIKPTVLVAVPRIFERIGMRVNAAVRDKASLAPLLFEAAVHVGWLEFLHGQHREPWHTSFLAWPVLKRAVADKVLALFGGQVRVAVCGGAALPPAVARFFIGLGLPIVQGYGMTETSPVVSVNRLDDNEPTSVGTPLQDVEVAIAEDGELLVKGPGVMMGYWGNREATLATIDAQGWLHTGDKAKIARSHIYITGRIKEIIVLANGEKVPPADMEAAISMDPLVEQVMVLGEGRPYLAAMIVVNGKEWRRLLEGQGVQGDAEALLRDKQVHALVLKRICEKLHAFPGYAQIRRISLQVEPWTVENELLTATLKLRRSRLLERFNDDIAELYQGH
jgi:long-chain acyl-CoA synthetase